MPRSKPEAQKKKKTRGRVRKEAPLPILTNARVTSDRPPCCYFTGYLEGCTVIVQHSGDVEFLYSMGFFGKGNLSRSEPTFEARQQRVNLPVVKKPSEQDKTDSMVQATVTSKRKYLAHLRYKALSDDEESLYNDIVQMEQSQLSGYGDVDKDDEEDLEEEDDDFEDEDEYGLDTSDIQALGRFGEKSTSKLTPDDLYRMPRSLLIALMSQVSLLTTEQITTFVRVPCTLPDLEMKYKLMRNRQVAFLKGYANEQKFHSDSNMQMSGGLSSEMEQQKGGFGKKGIINLEDGDDDAVVVLNSDEDDDNDDDDSVEKKDDEKSSVNKEEVAGGDNENKKRSGVKGWDDSDDEGDADFWGVEEDKGEKERNKDIGEGGKGSTSNTSESFTDSQNGVDVKTSQDSSEEYGDGGGEKIKTDMDSGDKEKESVDVKGNEWSAGGNKASEVDKSVGNEHENKLESSSNGSEHDSERNLDMKVDTDAKLDENDGCAKDEDKEEKLHASKQTPPLDGEGPPSSTPGTPLNEAKNMNNEKADCIDDDDDDDDVICVEEDSAQPAKLHHYLSQSSMGSSGTSSIALKPVTFLSSITEEPQFVSTQIGFRSWGNIVHFNFSGDHNHLPTGMSVLNDSSSDGRVGGDSNSDPSPLPTQTSSSSKSTSESDNEKEKLSQKNLVYERIYPPINSLVASPSSKGSVMKQKNDPVPFLDLAWSNLQQRFIPPSSHSNSLNPSWKQTHSSSTTNSPHQVSHYQSLSNHPKPSFWSHCMSQSAIQNQKQKLNSNPSSSPSNDSLLLSMLTSSLTSMSSQYKKPVTPSQLHLYLQVFQEPKETDMANKEEENQMETTDSSKEESNNVMLHKLHIQLSKTGLLKVNLGSKNDDNPGQDSTFKRSALQEFDKMLSEYLTVHQITLEQELMLLRILMYDEKSVAVNPIPKEFVSDLKSKITPGQVSCLLERMDYVQICVEKRQQDVSKASPASNEVITIDLSDDEEQEEEEYMHLLEDMKDNAASAEKAVPNDEISEEKQKECDINNSVGDSNVENKTILLNSKESESGKEDKVENCGDESDKDKDILVIGVKRQSDSSSENAVIDKTANKKLKIDSLELDPLSVDNENLESGVKTRTCEDGMEVEKKSSTNCHNDSQGEPKNVMNLKCLNDDDKSALSQSDKSDQKTNQNVEDRNVSCNSDESDVKSKRRDGKDLLTMSEHSPNSNGGSNAECSSDDKDDKDDGEVKGDKISGEQMSSKHENSEVQISELGVKNNGLEKQIVSGNGTEPGEEFNEIYIGSSDDDDEEIEEDIESVSRRFREGRKGKYFGVNSKTIRVSCENDDESGDNFVIANTSDEDMDDDNEGEDMMIMNGRGWQQRKNSKWRPCLKKDPYPTEEKLLLLLEEAFFLTFGLGCLRVLDQEMMPMTITSLWQRFMVVQEKFIPRYVAYHYFRSKGWVPKSGLKFGCDFILYREGPPFYHGSYSVVVIPVKGDTLSHMDGEDEEPDFSRRWTSWIALSGLNRITEHVSKELMLCYVIFPEGLKEEDAKSPKCISQFKVKEVVVSRWVSTRERETKDQLEEMP